MCLLVYVRLSVLLLTLISVFFGSKAGVLVVSGVFVLGDFFKEPGALYVDVCVVGSEGGIVGGCVCVCVCVCVCAGVCMYVTLWECVCVCVWVVAFFNMRIQSGIDTCVTMEVPQFACVG